MARALDALGVDIIEAGFPIASPADSEAVRQIARDVRRPVIAALARCRAAGHRGSGARARAGRALADPHVPRHLRSAPRRASCASRARRASRPRSTRVTLRAPLHRRCGVFGGGCDAQRSRFPLPRHRGGRSTPAARRSTCPTRSATRRPTRLREFFAEIIAPRAERRPRGLQHALPRRSRAGGRQQPGGDPGRRAAGRVHDQRHRRARRQRVARRDRDGAARPARTACRTTPAIRSRGAVRNQPAAVAAHQRAGPGEQGDRRPQRVRARSRHPPGRRAEGRAHLRDHAAGGRRPVGPSRLVLGRHSGRHAVQSRCEALGLHADARRDRRRSTAR